MVVRHAGWGGAGHDIPFLATHIKPRGLWFGVATLSPKPDEPKTH